MKKDEYLSNLKYVQSEEATKYEKNGDLKLNQLQNE